MKKFLTAKWYDLVMANYEVDPGLLAGRVPAGTDLDFHNDRCFVSLVAFKFLDTKVLGVPVPFHTDFEEVNLRFYVIRQTAAETRRGVVFVKEIVPRLMIALVARNLYGEPYETWQTAHEQKENELSYYWSKAGIENRVSIEIAKSIGVPEPDSHGEFIIEHYWGYTGRGGGRTDEYRVEHPKWELFNVNYAEIDVDFGRTYGAEFAFLSNVQPYSILLAKGSPISVYKGKPLAAGK